MKPLKLIMQAFGPYPGRETVDFEDLSAAGIFLIKGPTGSGKTTIFDAMSMALYGKSTVEEDKAKNGRNNFEIWRCNQAPWDTETLIEFTFLAGEKKYRFTRRLVPKVKKLDPVYAVSVCGQDGIFRAIDGVTKEAELAAKAEEVIGLNSSQFRQVVLLPQGKFEKFLTADSGEKEQILCRLFDAGAWESYAKAFYDRVDARKQLLTAEKQEADILLKSEENGFESQEELSEYITALKNDLLSLEESHKSFDAEKKKAGLEADRKTYEKFKRLEELTSTGIKLSNEAPEIKEQKEILKKAQNAEGLRENIRKTEELKTEYSRRTRDASKLKESIPRLTEEEKKSKEALEIHKNTEVVSDLNSRIGVLNSKKELYEKLDELKSSYAEAERKSKEEASGLVRMNDILTGAKDEAARKLKAYNDSTEYARECRTGYYANIYGEIADGLNDGGACPVCGSTSHPHPAPKSEDSVTKEECDRAEKDSLDKKAIWDGAEKKRADAEMKLSEQKKKADDALIAEQNCKTRYEEALKNLVSGIGSTKELLREIEKLQHEIDAYNAETIRRSNEYEKKHDELKGVSEKLAALNGECEAVKANLDTELKELEKALAQKGYPDIEAAGNDMRGDDDKNRILESITAHETKVTANKEETAAQEELVRNLEKPDPEKFAERASEIENEASSYAKKSASLTKDIARLSAKEKEIDKKLRHYNDNIREAENDMAFAKKLRGDTGIGLQRYVLGIMFNQIISEANRMLTMVHNGRYHLLRTDEKGSGNKRGLELIVHDSRNPDKTGRPVSSLSGGEKFLVSLSLSIGMSAAAQKSGLRIEALFIDEGFGTLDESSISDAMDILECVRESSGMIGVISHVSVLENNIPKHLEIVKTEKGSSIKAC